ncbi:MAG: enoyl-CoA hydratase-related protein, partial [Candidatus Hydrogenedentales bacterium]
MATQHPVEVAFEDRGASGTVARVTLAFAGSLNIAGSGQIAELNRALLTLRNDDRLRVVVLQSVTEKAFIGGADIHEMAELDP